MGVAKLCILGGATQLNLACDLLSQTKNPCLRLRCCLCFAAVAAVTCDQLQDPANGGIIIDDELRRRGTIATYSCARGFTLLDGDKIRVCEENQNWSGTKPACSMFPCYSVVAVVVVYCSCWFLYTPEHHCCVVIALDVITMYRSHHFSEYLSTRYRSIAEDWITS